jgi:hypothetical protein
MYIKNYAINYDAGYTPGELIRSNIEQYYPYDKDKMIQQITNARFGIKQKPIETASSFQDFLNLQMQPSLLFDVATAPGLAEFNQISQIFNQ